MKTNYLLQGLILIQPSLLHLVHLYSHSEIIGLEHGSLSNPDTPRCFEEKHQNAKGRDLRNIRRKKIDGNWTNRSQMILGDKGIRIQSRVLYPKTSFRNENEIIIFRWTKTEFTTDRPYLTNGTSKGSLAGRRKLMPRKRSSTQEELASKHPGKSEQIMTLQNNV